MAAGNSPSPLPRAGMRRRSLLAGILMLTALGRPAEAAADLPFARVTSLKEFDAAVSRARSRRKPVLVYVSAEWCPVCKAIDGEVFSNVLIRRRLEGVALVRADVTAADVHSRTLMERLNAPGPPTLFVVAAKTGMEMPRTRLTGPVSANLFLDTINLAGL
jgi:thiol:disulfide interchange protein DsbD